MMKKSTLQQKLSEIKQQQEQAVANLHALQGAEQMLQLLIAECGDEENEEDNN